MQFAVGKLYGIDQFKNWWLPYFLSTAKRQSNPPSCVSSPIVPDLMPDTTFWRKASELSYEMIKDIANCNNLKVKISYERGSSTDLTVGSALKGICQDFVKYNMWDYYNPGWLTVLERQLLSKWQEAGSRVKSAPCFYIKSA